jgi:hypothetical protein
MVRGGRAQDCPGVKYHLVRGALDLVGPTILSVMNYILIDHRVVSVAESRRGQNTERRNLRLRRTTLYQFIYMYHTLSINGVRMKSISANPEYYILNP